MSAVSAGGDELLLRDDFGLVVLVREDRSA